MTQTFRDVVESAVAKLSKPGERMQMDTLAKRVGCHRMYIYMLMRGIRSPGEEMLPKLAKGLVVSERTVSDSLRETAKLFLQNPKLTKLRSAKPKSAKPKSAKSAKPKTAAKRAG